MSDSPGLGKPKDFDGHIFLIKLADFHRLNVYV